MAEFTTVSSGPQSLATFKFCNVGASIAAYILHTPSRGDRHLVTGFTNPESYQLSENPFFGATVGRVANRIKGGLLRTSRGTYQLGKNEGENTLHGGPQTYHTRTFSGPSVSEEEGGVTSVTYTLLDKHEDGGFPGTVAVKVTYRVSEVDKVVRLEVEYEATLEGDAEETAINLANHSYFTVSGADNIAGTEILLSTNKIVEVNDVLIPTGKIVEYPVIPVSNGKIQPLALGAETKDGFADHCFVIRDDCGLDTRADEMQLFATLSHKESGVSLKAYTTEPAFQFYTGDGTDTSNVKGESKVFGRRAGMCLEAQRYIDATSNDKWKSQVLLSKGQTYGSKTRYEASLL